ncbi:hypothetical protein ACRJ4W_03695 [Streptomyces sp. GLT-R25]
MPGRLRGVARRAVMASTATAAPHRVQVKQLGELKDQKVLTRDRIRGPEEQDPELLSDSGPTLEPLGM